MIIFGCLFLFAGIADARVDFYGGQIFDEYDFKGQAAVSVIGPCSDSCAIYASVTPDSLKLANNLLIQTPIGFVSIGDLANRKNQTTSEKLPVIIKSTHELKIVNGNANANAGPLVLYIVEGSHDGRVFEADGLDFAITEPMFMTVMSARPFTLKQDDDEAALGPVRVTLTGFDGMYDLDCPDIYKRDQTNRLSGLAMEVNGPIITFVWDKGFPQTHLTATIGITSKQIQMHKTSFISSPGAHGCRNKTLYRSSLYDVTSKVHAEITADIKSSVGGRAIADAETLNQRALKLADGTFAIHPQNSPFGFNFGCTKKWTVDWTPPGTETDFFLVHWEIQPNQ